MEKHTFALCLLIIFSGLSLIGCQNAPIADDAADNTTDLKTQQEVIEKGVPFSKGPSASPADMRGPDAPPPESEVNQSETPQAVTTNENIRITLPRKTD